MTAGRGWLTGGVSRSKPAPLRALIFKKSDAEIVREADKCMYSAVYRTLSKVLFGQFQLTYGCLHACMGVGQGWLELCQRQRQRQRAFIPVV